MFESSSRLALGSIEIFMFSVGLEANPGLQVEHDTDEFEDYVSVVWGVQGSEVFKNPESSILVGGF